MNELRDLFELARDLPASQREEALLAQTSDTAMVREVLALLDAAGATQTRGRAPVRSILAQLDATELHTGDKLGAWLLMREIGHGGMGAVYLAERADGHFRQQAAIKLIRGFADEDAMMRFARERQLLADLQHPQIARLLDGGATPSGAPYLVMEYIEGVPLDEWCEKAHTGLDERLRLFVSTCKTLQFAHQHLIVHCDLKPSNVLVRDDDTPVLLDFGIARALGREDVVTAESYLTPRYASPEQIRGEPPTLASDVYALGLLLYRLAADASPPAFDKDAPSALPAPSATESPVPWRTRLRGDLDAIVARACALDPVQRYPSALALAEDIGRIAAHQPVQARSHTPLYVASRLLRRRWPLFAGSALMFALTVGFTWRTVQAEYRALDRAQAAERAEREARSQAQLAERTTDFLVSAFALADPTNAERHDFSAREVLDRGAARIEEGLSDEPRARARLLEALGNAYRGINERDAGRQLLDRAANLYLDPAVNEPVSAARSLSGEAQSVLASGQSSLEVEQVARRAIELTQQYEGNNRRQIADGLEALAWTLEAQRRMPEALAAERQALRLREESGADAEQIALNSTRLCRILGNTGEAEEALPQCERSVSLLRGANKTQGRSYVTALLKYSFALQSLSKNSAAIAALRESDDVSRTAFGEDSLELAHTREHAAVLLAEMGQFAQAEALLAKATPVILRRNGEQSDQYARALDSAGWIKFECGEFTAAVSLLRHAVEINAAKPGEQYKNGWQVYRSRLGAALIEAGEAGTKARELLDEVTAQRTAAGADAYELAYTRLPLARWHVANRQFNAAEALLEQIEAMGNKSATEYRAYAANTRAAIARARGDIAAALRFDDSAYRLMLQALGADNPFTAHYALLLARSLRQAGQNADAATFEQRYRGTFDRAFPADSAFRHGL